jgi:hypothetical protein
MEFVCEIRDYYHLVTVPRMEKEETGEVNLQKI